MARTDANIKSSSERNDWASKLNHVVRSVLTVACNKSKDMGLVDGNLLLRGAIMP